MRYVLAGASGFLGRALRTRLVRDGHDVVRLVRREPTTPHESRWDPATGELDPAVLDGASVVVNLAGASIGRVPWTASYRQVVVRSRVDTTRTLAQAVAAVPRPPVFLAQSAIGYYGKGRADTPLDEEAGPGSGFFADLVCAWEEAATPAEAAGARVVRMRSGVVLDRSGGPFPLLALPFRFGLGGRLGSGQQVMGMISLDDWLAAVLFLVEHPDCQGPYNLTMPDPPTNAEFTKALAAALHRPAPLVVPAVAIRTVLRGLADELLGSARVVPRRLLDAGFEFSAPDVTTLVAAALHRR